MNKVLDKFPALARETQLKKHFKDIIPHLEKVNESIALQVQTFDPNVMAYVEYATETGGKRIRPALVLLSAHALGELNKKHIDLAVVIELIHLASLIHDDIMDQALIRRKKPTMCQKWGNELSVLVGDSLLAHAFKMCTRFSSSEVSKQVADAASEVCTGEILQTQRRYDLKLSVQDYLKIVSMKTGALFRVATELAAFCSDQDTDIQKRFSIYGDQLGTAYQIYDDCLDLFGKEDVFGKTLGTDLARGKMTLPVIWMLEQLNEKESEEISEVILHGEGSDYGIVVDKVIKSGGHTYAVRKAKDLLERSDKMLEGIESNGYLEALRMLPRSLNQDLDALKV
ncbi:MAG: polyprenyl synthetase family protein [Verrucomicrobiota bacterium]